MSLKTQVKHYKLHTLRLTTTHLLSPKFHDVYDSLAGLEEYLTMSTADF